MVNESLCFFLICLLVLLQSESTASVKLTLVKDAVANGAVCLDGSPPAYQLDRGVGEGANKWLVHLEGGAWCESVDACRKRKQYGLGSSHLMKEMRFGGILSNNQSVNPNFYYWNRVFVRYCDGSSFTGDVEQVNVTDPLYYRGAKVFDAIVEDILEEGMYNASNALLSGCSAGGLAAILHCDKFRGLLPPSSKVKCFSDGGYFVHAKDISGGYHYEQVMFDRVVALHGSEKNLPRSCTSVTKPDALCFYPQYVAPHIKTPLFILNSLYDTWQVSFIFSLANIPAGRSWVECQFEVSNCSECLKQTLQGFRVQVLGAVLNGLTNRSSRGFFLNTCHTHCQSLHSDKWIGKSGSMLHNKSISEALGEWYYDERPVQLIETRDLLPHWCVIDKSEPNPTNNYTWNG